MYILLARLGRNWWFISNVVLPWYLFYIRTHQAYVWVKHYLIPYRCKGLWVQYFTPFKNAIISIHLYPISSSEYFLFDENPLNKKETACQHVLFRELMRNDTQKVAVDDYLDSCIIYSNGNDLLAKYYATNCKNGDSNANANDMYNYRDYNNENTIPIITTTRITNMG